jgi:hypothetical protein
MLRDITMKQLRIATVVCAFSFSIAHVKAKDQFLVDEGKAYAVIIINESPARLAAAELQTLRCEDLRRAARSRRTGAGSR